MGYTTDFAGQFELNTPLDQETREFLVKLNETRRMKRNAAKLKAETGIDYGIDGEFYVDGDGFAGQGDGGHIIDHNNPPSTQPGLWCQWRPTDKGDAIEWDGGEKFYCYVEWLEYIIEKVLRPKGYFIDGAVQWRGEDFNDLGTIIVIHNKVNVYPGKLKEMPKPKVKVKTKKTAPKAENETVQLVSHKHNGATYFESHSLCETLKLCKKASGEKGKAIDLAIKEIQRIAGKA